MGLSNGELSAADVAAVVGNNNNRGYGFGGFGGDESFWVIVLFLFALMNGNWGGNNNGQVTSAVQAGFDQAAIVNGINGLNQTAFANQNAMNQGFYNMASQFANCCCENRLATANLGADIAREACADRAATASALRDVIEANNASTQRILDQLCQDKIDAKNEQIANLRQQMNMMQLSASQTAQTQALIANNELQTAALEQYLAPTPRPAYIVQNPNCCQQSYYNGCNGF